MEDFRNVWRKIDRLQDMVINEMKELKELLRDRAEINNSTVGDSFEFINKKFTIASEGNTNTISNNERPNMER